MLKMCCVAPAVKDDEPPARARHGRPLPRPQQQQAAALPDRVANPPRPAGVQRPSQAATPAAPRTPVPSPSTGSRRLQTEVRRHRRDAVANQEAGVMLQPKGEDNLFVWTVHVRPDPSTRLGQTLAASPSRSPWVELEVRLEPDYPLRAPTNVRVVQPRITGHGNVVQGALCFDTATAKGWLPAMDLRSLALSCLSVLSSDGYPHLHIDWRHPYSQAEAEQGRRTLESIHGWQAS